VALGLYTVGGAIFQYFQTNQTIVAALAVPVVSLVAASVRGRFISIPPILIDELCKDGVYTCSPCTTDNLKISCEIVRPLFGEHNVDWRILEQWRIKCPYGFMQIENDQRELTACFVILALEEAFFDQLIAGRVVEGDISSAVVLPMRMAKKQRKLYICGVMVRDAHTYIGAKRARIMIWCMMKYLRHHFGLGKELFAVALNPDSAKLLASLGFTVITRAENRRDRHDFYRITASDELWGSTEQRIGDLGRCCAINYVLDH
jgi:hypothetical protein